MQKSFLGCCALVLFTLNCTVAQHDVSYFTSISSKKSVMAENHNALIKNDLVFTKNLIVPTNGQEQFNLNAVPSCLQLGSDPAYGLVGNSSITNLKVSIVTAEADKASPVTNLAEMMAKRTPLLNPYCQVDFTYNAGKSGVKDGYKEGQSQALGIRVGLPLRADDGGTNGWNGNIHNIGSGGCMGYLPSLKAATNTGYVSSGSDGGHGAPYILFDCDFGVNQTRNTLNNGLIRDFSLDHVIWQTHWSKALTKIYYGKTQKYTYWSGCSQGGRQGHIILQNIPEEYDGVIAGGSALYWMRFQMVQAWSGLVIKDMLRTKGKTLTPLQISAATDAAIASCDIQDGVKNGILADPRNCHWSAKNFMKGMIGVPDSVAFDEDQANAYDLIRRGPVNSKGELIWFPYEADTRFSIKTDYLLSDGIMHWAVGDTTFSSDKHLYMDKAHLMAANDSLGITYEDMATIASQRVSDLADVDNIAIEKAAKSGLKFISWTGTADRNIHSRNSIYYYREVAEHLKMKIDDPKFQSWFRLFLFPGVDHCAGGDGPQPGDVNGGVLLEALTNWVEKGIAPDKIIATKYEGQMRGPVPGTENRAAMNKKLTVKVATVPVFPYPKTAIYNGTGELNDANSYTGGGNLETPEIIKQDKIAKHKFENGTGKIPALYTRKKE